MLGKCEKFLISAVLALWSQAGLAQVTLPAILEIDAENIVGYSNDVFDPSKFATDPKPTTVPQGGARNFGFVMGVGDIVAVNGKPAKGTLVVRQQVISLSPTPTPGQGVADTARASVADFLLEIQQPDGSPVGNIHTLGLAGGAAAVGGPPGSIANFTVAGGTGAFLGSRGQMLVRLLPEALPRFASVTEDPAGRRTNGGGRLQFVVQLIPMTRPAIVSTAAGLAVVHANDFSLVTTARPAQPGEILSLFATGLGPTRPAVDPGKPFPANPLAAVNSPVEVMVNGKPAELLAAVGFPGSVDTYQVNFRVPPDTVRGSATIQLSAAWIAGAEVRISVQ